MIKLYGIAQSRAFRCLWMLEELGIEYEHVPVHFMGDELQSPDYLAINPNGKIPALVDGDIKMFESLAINFYLAQKYNGGLWPEGLENQAYARMWSFWVVNEIEDDLLTVLLHRVLAEPEERDLKKAEAAEAMVRPRLAILDQALKEKRYLVGDSFTVADLNVASVLSWAKYAHMSFNGYVDLGKWLDECLSRPATRKAIRD